LHDNNSCRKEWIEVKTTREKRVFVAVNVWRGIISDVKAFQDEKSALRRASYWRRSANAENDDIGVYETIVRRPKSGSTSRSVAIRPSQKK
jgi:hypothetical protein